MIKKLLMILIILIIPITVLLSSEIIVKDRLNNYLITFQAEKIIYNGQNGFFIPINGYNQLTSILRDYIYLQDYSNIQNEKIINLQKHEIMNFRLKTALGISISFNVGEILIASALSILTYTLAKN